MVRVRFSSAVQSAANGDLETTLEHNGDVESLLHKLAEKYGESFSKRIFENGKPRKYVNVYVNGKDIRFLKNLETEVKEGDVVDLIPAVSGG